MSDLTKPEIEPTLGDAPTELVITDLVVGDGAEAAPGATVDVHYVGVDFETGEQFDASWDRGSSIQFPLAGLIRISKCHIGKITSGINFDKCHIGLVVATDNASAMFRPIGQGDRYFSRTINHMVVGNNISGGINDETTAQATPLRRCECPALLFKIAAQHFTERPLQLRNFLPLSPATR